MLVESGGAAASVGTGEDTHEVALSALVVGGAGAVEAGAVAGLADTGSVHVVAGVALAGVCSGDGGIGAAS